MLSAPRTPHVDQRERTECGLACLAMVAGHHWPAVDLAAVRARVGSVPRGMTLAQLASAAEHFDLRARAVRLEPEALSELNLPAILHWDMDHFVVLVRVRRGRCLVSDPALGRRWYKRSTLGRHFTGIALELSPTDAQSEWPATAQRLRLRRLFSFAQTVKPRLGLLLTLSILLQVLLLAGPLHLQWLVDRAVLESDFDLVTVLASGFAVLLVLRSGVLWLRSTLIAYLGHTLALAFATETLKRLLALRLDWFGGRNTGDIAARFASLEPVRAFFTEELAAFTVDAFIVLVALLLMFAYSPALAWVVIGLQMLLVFGTLWVAPNVRRLSQDMVQGHGADQAQLLESIRGITSIKVYALERRRLEGWQRRHARTLRASLDLQRWQTGLLAFTTLVQGIELIVVLTLGAQSILRSDGLTLGMLLAFVSFRGHFSDRLKSVMEHWLGFRTLSVHLDRLADIWLDVPEVQLPGELTAPAPEARAIVLKNVEFRYGALQPPVLEAFSLRIEPGEWVAIVGASGVGKSTLLRILMGLVEPTGGTVLLGDRVLEGLTRNRFRSQSACVLQDDGFFSGSIGENVALDDVWDQARLDDAFARVGLDSFLTRLPMGARTQLSDIVGQFSSGQMQRLYLARALYRAPEYLFLDEGTAHLDRENVELVKHLLGELSCTRVTVTHDIDLARAADRIVTLTRT